MLKFGSSILDVFLNISPKLLLHYQLFLSLGTEQPCTCQCTVVAFQDSEKRRGISGYNPISWPHRVMDLSRLITRHQRLHGTRIAENMYESTWSVEHYSQ